ncbi:MAG: TonB-dependent siderophore receptor [Nostoc sp.]|uniref:TonB-dependent siderophore receptor n=1 Tax=Nostoc sp. TaxID=1180 RepID=UPI002FF80270
MQQLWQFFIFHLGIGIFVHLFLTQGALAESQQSQVITEIPTVTNSRPLSTDAKDLLSQNIENDLVIKITQVKVNTTNKGIDVILETTASEKLQIDVKSQGNNFIADIKNAQLFLPSGNKFSQQQPAQGITTVTATNFDANTIRLTVTGEVGLPAVELYDSPREGLVFAVASATTSGQLGQQPPLQQPEAQQKPTSETQPEQPSAGNDEPIELVVTGEQDGYRVSNTSVGTKTDTPLRDTPQSIQVVPRQLIEDQRITNLGEALRNVPGARQSDNSSARGNNALPQIRGFSSQDNIITNGSKNTNNIDGGFNFANIERIEVLKGPASVLYGQGSLGGVVNLVTKKPLAEPYYFIETSAGSYNFYSGAIDLSGPLNDNKSVLYRLNVAALTTKSFVDFYDEQQYIVAPTLSWQISDRTKLTLASEYKERSKNNGNFGLPFEGTLLPSPNGRLPRNLNPAWPDSKRTEISVYQASYELEHRFSKDWELHSSFLFSQEVNDRATVDIGEFLPDLRTVDRYYAYNVNHSDTYNFDTYTVGKFQTGSIEHQLLTGFNYQWGSSSDVGGGGGPFDQLDLYNPVYSEPAKLGLNDTYAYATLSKSNSYGFYIQDRLTLAENLKLVLGGRYDIANSKGGNIGEDLTESPQQEAFSPRVGIVYQPIEPVSLYASYSRSFTPQGGQDFDGNLFQPERGTQYEVGVKVDLNDKLSATLALYDLTRSNILTSDPDEARRNLGFQVQIGEQRSRGIEFDVSGEILPGWNIIANYAFTDSRITKDNDYPIGDELRNVPKHSASLWTKYEIQSGSLQGLSFGVGVFYVGERQALLPNDSQYILPSYVTTDAAIFYKRDRFRAALNFKNLFDLYYFESGGLLGDPFTVQGTISWEL